MVALSATFSEHLHHLRKVLDCFRVVGLQLNSKTCTFGAREIKVLGHMASFNGTHPDPDKLRALAEYITASNVKELRSFLELCTYFRRLIADLSHIAEPLQQLLRGDVAFTWGIVEEASSHR